MNYPINVEWSIDTWLVTFPDFPEGVADGDSEEEARINAVETLEACIAFRLDEGSDIPRPPGVGVSPETADKLREYWSKKEK